MLVENLGYTLPQGWANSPHEIRLISDVKPSCGSGAPEFMDGWKSIVSFWDNFLAG